MINNIKVQTLHIYIHFMEKYKQNLKEKGNPEKYISNVM